MSFFWNSGSSSSLFGSGSLGSSGLYSTVSEMSMIKRGSYKNLLKSYYGQNTVKGSDTASSAKKNNNTDKSGSILEKLIEERKHPYVSAETQKANSGLTSGLGYLKSSISTLQNANTYKDTEKGSTAENKVLSAMKTFVSDYNDVVTSSKKSTLSGKTAYVANMMSATAKNADKLSEVGITVQRDGTLLLDQKKLKSADISKVQTLFSADNTMSYGSTISSRVQFAGASSGTSKDTANQTKDSSASDLKTDSTALASDKLYAKVKDSNGNETDKYNVDQILSTAKSFVKNYNGMLDATKASSNSGVVANLSYIKERTAKNAAALEQFGISADKNGKLSLDADKFKNSDMSKVQNFFKDYGSFVANYASRVNYYMTTNANAANGYTSNAAYNVQPAASYETAV